MVGVWVSMFANIMAAEESRLGPPEDDGCALAFLLAHDAPREPQDFIPASDPSMRVPDAGLIVVR
jgi:hypothetical protein